MTDQTYSVVTISNDPSILGDDADLPELEAYAANLADYLSEKFDCDVDVRLASVYSPTADRQDIEDRVKEIHRSDEWTNFL